MDRYNMRCLVKQAINDEVESNVKLKSLGTKIAYVVIVAGGVAYLFYEVATKLMML